MKTLERLNEGTRIYFTDSNLKKGTVLNISTKHVDISELIINQDVKDLYCRIDLNTSAISTFLDITLKLDDNNQTYNNDNGYCIFNSEIDIEKFLTSIDDNQKEIKFTVTLDKLFRKIFYNEEKIPFVVKKVDDCYEYFFQSNKLGNFRFSN